MPYRHRRLTYDWRMPTIEIDGAKIQDFASFHSVFADALGFPAFYGRNLNAWIDCMCSIGSPDHGMTAVHATTADPLVLRISAVDEIPTEILNTLNHSVAYVNWFQMVTAESPLLLLAYHVSPTSDVVAQRIRNRIIEYLELASSAEDRVDYQANVRSVYVPHEIFNQWEDWVPKHPDTITWDPSIYTHDEVSAIKAFHAAWSASSDALAESQSSIEELQEAPDWTSLRSAASSALQVFKREGKRPED